MTDTFINLPTSLLAAVSRLLGDTNSRDVLTSARKLHGRYMDTDRTTDRPIVKSGSDVLAYLSLRYPATYAQIASALEKIKERLPEWKPETVLDLGCGPGTGLFASHEVFPSITTATEVDREDAFLTIGETLARETNLPMNVSWKKQTVAQWIADAGSPRYDLIIVANVINELPAPAVHDLLSKLAALSGGIVLLLEPGTPHGFKMIQSAAEKITKYRPLVAPYINGKLVQSHDFWIHFPQRFIRPEFQRAVRSDMRDSNLAASDWEETKYSFVAFGDVTPAMHPHAVAVGAPEIYHGYLTVRLLTESGIETVKVMKRHKEQYRFAKNLSWGDTVAAPDLLLV